MCLVSVAPGIAVSPNRALGPLVATFVWNCVALLDTVPEGNLALWPGTLTCWAPSQGTLGFFLNHHPPPGQCVGRVGRELVPRPLGQAQMHLPLSPWAFPGLLSDGRRAKTSLKSSLLGLMGGVPRAISSNGLIWQTEKLNFRQEVPCPRSNSRSISQP